MIHVEAFLFDLCRFFQQRRTVAIDASSLLHLSLSLSLSSAFSSFLRLRIAAERTNRQACNFHKLPASTRTRTKVARKGPSPDERHVNGRATMTYTTGGAVAYSTGRASSRQPEGKKKKKDSRLLAVSLTPSRERTSPSSPLSSTVPKIRVNRDDVSKKCSARVSFRAPPVQCLVFGGSSPLKHARAESTWLARSSLRPRAALDEILSE